MTKIEKELREEIAKLRERIAVLEARPHQPSPIIVNPVYPQPQTYPVYIYQPNTTPWDHTITC